MRILAVFFLFHTFSLLRAQEVGIFLNEDSSSQAYHTLEVSGLLEEHLQKFQGQNLSKEDWQELFPVYTGSQKPPSASYPPMLGRYQVEANLIRFIPRFPFVADMDYYAEFDLGQFYQKIDLGANLRVRLLQKHFKIAASPSVSTTQVEKIYPSTSVVPANLLKFYIYFSAPMRLGQSLEKIHLYNERGEQVEAPFLPMPEELWDRERKRLTLFFDPGRIKRGLKPHRDQGTPLEPNQKYRLVIEQDWKDAYGKPLVKAFVKTFQTSPPDRVQPDPEKWKILPPQADTKEQFIVQFPEALDGVLAERYLNLFFEEILISGQIQIEDEGRKWVFSPQIPWESGKYQLKIHTRLEDLAGNSIRRLFDTNTQIAPSPIERQVDEYIYLDFEIK